MKPTVVVTSKSKFVGVATKEGWNEVFQIYCRTYDERPGT